MPLQDAQTNILGTIAILQQCVQWNVNKIVYASTAAVYGNPQYLGVDEVHPINPLSHYAVSKFACEQYIKLYSEIYNLDYTILRYSNVYGNRQDSKGEGGVVSLFIRRILEGQPPIIYGDGRQTRDFIHVKDVVSANIAALNKGSKGIYNISSNQQTSINELVDLLVEISGDKYMPLYTEARKGEIYHSYLENKLAREILGWSPKYGLKGRFGGNI